MQKSDLFPKLADISFAERNPTEIESVIITGYEQAAGRSLAKGDPVRLFLETIALVIIQQRQLIDYAAKMNLLAYATGDYLDHIGAMLGVERLEASSATTTLEFTMSTPSTGAMLIPKGTRASAGTDIYFATDEAAEIPNGSTSIQVKATCSVTGDVGNGFLPRQINKIVDPLPWEISVTNITLSANGADVESDENFRERIQMAPESFSVAGSRGAYEYYARSAHSSIVDVAVVGPSDSAEVAPGHVEIYPLRIGGELPTPEILAAVEKNCSAEDVRPLTDYVQVKTPTTRNFNVDLSYWIDRGNATSANAIQKAVDKAIADWVAWQKSKLGRDINPSELEHRIIAAGAKRAVIRLPAFTALKASEIAIANDTTNVIFEGLEDG